MEHTPTPWTTRISSDLKKYEQRKVIEIVGNVKDGILDPVAEMVEYEDGTIDAANAAFIVQAVNAYDPLLEALEKMLVIHDSDTPLHAMARTAIAKAKGEA